MIEGIFLNSGILEPLGNLNPHPLSPTEAKRPGYWILDSRPRQWLVRHAGFREFYTEGIDFGFLVLLRVIG